MKSHLAMNQCCITGVLVAAARTHKGWHEQRRQRVCSLPLGECFTELAKTHSAVVVSRWLPGLMHAFVPRLISCCQRWQEVIWWCSLSSGPLTDSDKSGKRCFLPLIWIDKHWALLKLGLFFSSFGHSVYWPQGRRTRGERVGGIQGPHVKRAHKDTRMNSHGCREEPIENA